jgi:hypothetical protein
MKTLKLDQPWSYVTPETTIDFGKGSHQVTSEIHAAAVAAGVTPDDARKDTKDGGGTTEGGAAGDPAAAQG